MYELISCDLLTHAECEIYDDLLTAKCTDWICEVEDKLKELENAECATVADVLHPNGDSPMRDSLLPVFKSVQFVAEQRLRRSGNHEIRLNSESFRCQFYSTRFASIQFSSVHFSSVQSIQFKSYRIVSRLLRTCRAGGREI